MTHNKTQVQYTAYGTEYQVCLPLNIEKIIPSDEPVRLLSAVLEELDYGYIFEDYPLWGEFCYLLLKDVHEKFHKDILVPMTLLRAESYSIIEKLLQDGIDTRLVVLEASYQTVHDRILARGEEEGCWCIENIELARAGSAALPGIHIQTDGKSVENLMDELLTVHVAE